MNLASRAWFRFLAKGDNGSWALQAGVFAGGYPRHSLFTRSGPL